MRKQMQRGEADRFISLFESNSGWGAVVSGLAGIREVLLPFGWKTREELVASLAATFPWAADARSDAVSDEAAARLTRYFHGDEVDFRDLPLDLSLFTTFQAAVYRVVAAIPYGKVMTYREVAVAAGKAGAARGIGGAMARNPVPVIIPCHRVVGSSGSMTGYSASGGITSKLWLLRLEGVHLTPRGRIERA